MKKFLTIAALAAALVGCQMSDKYDIGATRAQGEEVCQRFNGVFTVMSLSVERWIVTCVNTSTGNSFKAYVPGVLK